MPNLRDIELRTRSVQKTQKLTNAMKMVASARLRRAEARMVSARRFHENLSRIFANVDFSYLPPDELPLVQGRRPVSDIGLIVIAGERGLCGAFNNNIIQYASRLYQQSRNVKFICLGRKALTFFTQHNFPIIFGRAGITEDMSFVEANDLAHEIIQLFSDGVMDEVQLLYHRFQSMMVQRITHEKLIPAIPQRLHKEKADVKDKSEDKNESEDEDKPEFSQMIYEPQPVALLQRLAPFMVAAHIYRAVTESSASELAARRMAMENATDNADEMVRTLTLAYNRTRQSVITREMLEVVVGGESLK